MIPRGAIGRALLAVVAITAAGCSVSEQDDSIMPAWLVARIIDYEKGPADSAPTEIWKITHHGKPAYYFIQPCCDSFNPVYDTAGVEICNPTGGIAGHGDGKCPEPRDKDTEAEFVWSHSRGVVHEHVRPTFAGW
jgi:hypothetical protein